MEDRRRGSRYRAAIVRPVLQWTRGLVLFPLLLIASAQAAALLDGPRILVAEPTFDAGAVAEGDQLEHMFELRNAGSEQLVIQRLVPN